MNQNNLNFLISHMVHIFSYEYLEVFSIYLQIVYHLFILKLYF